LRLLLDTHIVLWQLQGRRVVPDRARRAIERATDLVFSVVSFAEIGVKAAIGKLVVPDDLHDHVLATGLRVLGLAPDHGLMVADLPMHHRDPFDRLLIAQALAEELTVVTADPRFASYGVLTVDAAAT
jgi:PIN domain nuclease of toxin-antitoxin system